MSVMYANAEIETMPRERLEELQLERLQKAVKWAAEKSAFYQQKFDAAGVQPDDIKTLADIRKLPFVTSLELHQASAMDRLTMPMSSVLRVSYQKEMGREMLSLYSNGDIAHNVEMMARALVAGGINKTSTVGVQGDMSDSRLQDVQYALEFLGATSVPLGTDYQHWLRLFDLVSMDAVVSTPQLIMQLLTQMQAAGRELSDTSVKRFFCLNDTGLQNLLQRHVVERAKASLFNFYSAPELGMASVLYQCEEQQGQHVQEDFWYPEIVAFGQSEPVSDENAMGELVLTSLVAEALPLIRYRTGQAVSLRREPCACGRTFVRVSTPYTSPIM